MLTQFIKMHYLMIKHCFIGVYPCTSLCRAITGFSVTVLMVGQVIIQQIHFKTLDFNNPLKHLDQTAFLNLFFVDVCFKCIPLPTQLFILSLNLWTVVYSDFSSDPPSCFYLLHNIFNTTQLLISSPNDPTVYHLKGTQLLAVNLNV